MSLGLRLTLLNGLLLLLCIGVFAAIAYVTQREGLQRNLDQSLHEQASFFSDNTSAWFDWGAGRPRFTFPNPQKFTAPEVFVQITTRDGATVRSQNLDDTALPKTPDMLDRALNGDEWFVEVQLEGQPLRVLVAPLRVSPTAAPPPGPRGRVPEPFGGVTGPVGMIQVARPLAPLQSTLTTLQTTFLTTGALGILASLLVGWLLARAALQPIGRLGAAAHGIGMARDFSRRVSVPKGRRDEVGRLAEDFNQMLAQLQSAYEQLESTLDAQRRFVADASHELRTPLTSLRGNLELLRRDAALGPPAGNLEEQETLLADLIAETERLSRLVADLLVLARADAGQHLSLVPTEAGPVFRDAFRAARFLREGVFLHLEAVPDNAWVAGDPDRLKQLLLILLDNALKYTPAGGNVFIGARVAQAPSPAVPGAGFSSPGGGEGLALYVRDTGPGIPEVDRSRIFDRFYRVDRARGAGGAGLGLAIARWITEEHHGSIAVESNPGAGSTFTVWLPTVPRPVPATPEPSLV